MRILHIGCSWSEITTYFGDNSSVPQEVSKLITVPHRLDVCTYGGTSINMHFELLKELTSKTQDDFVFIQITAAYRDYVRKTSWKPMKDVNWIKYKDTCVYENRSYIEENYEWYNPANFHRCDKDTKKFALNYFKYKLDQEYIWAATIKQVEKYLNFNQIPFIMYHHILDHLVNKDPFILSEANDYMCINTILGEKFNNYCVDKQLHMHFL